MLNTSKISPCRPGHRHRRFQPPGQSLARAHDKIKEAGDQVIGVEGEETGEWVLVDLGDIVVHVMQPAVRAYYNLEELWQVAPDAPGRRPPATPPEHEVDRCGGFARPPPWVAGRVCQTYATELPLELLEIKPEPRSTGKTAAAMMALEAARIEAQLPTGCRRIARDERGEARRGNSRASGKWMAGGGDIAFLIGGPTADARLKNSAHETMRLSGLTCPTRWCASYLPRSCRQRAEPASLPSRLEPP